MAQFFIDRPIFAWVLAIIVMLAGLISLQMLPVAQYPAIAPPQVAIEAIYPGADAQTLENTVTQVIEQEMKGIDNLLYISSSSDASGQAEVTLTFNSGTDPDIAQVQVQNKLQLAMPRLPELVQRQGVKVSKSSANFLLVVSLVSRDNSMQNADISDYIYSHLLDPISRLEGVGDVTVFGGQYAMRIWCDPEKFHEYGLMPTDVAAAIEAQNVQLAGGQIGAAPAVVGQEINLSIIATSQLKTVEQFEKIILRSLPDGSNLYLKDVARIELNNERFFATSRYNKHNASAIAIKLASGANALQTADGVKQKMAEMSAYFPQGLDVAYAFDTTPFVRISIDEVYKTLAEAIFLVFLVMYLFLQDFRATLIPTIAIPVVLLGTFAVLSVAGFSINTLTMFAMVLAIGLLVDDAIVVVENVERIIREDRLSPKEAAKKSMHQITGALVGIGLVLSAVFIPMAFFGGSTGVIYRQFSITIVAAMTFSVLVALILTPALCATLLRPHVAQTQEGILGRFNRWFDRVSLHYQSLVSNIIGKSVRYFLLYCGIIGLIALLFFRLPSAFFPDEDQGMCFVLVQLPQGATFERTLEVLSQVEDHFLNEEKDAVEGMMTVAGFSFAGNGQNVGMGFIRLKDWKERKNKNLSVAAVVKRAEKLRGIREAFIITTAPPAVVELATSTGFEFQLTDRNSLGHEKLVQAGNELLQMGRTPFPIEGATTEAPASIINPMSLRQNGLPDMQQIQLEIDYEQAGSQGVSPADINRTISAFWGGLYVNDFLDNGRTKKVFLQADAQYRMQPQDIYRYFVRNNKEQMVPLANFVKPVLGFGSPRLERFDGVSSLAFLGEALPGKSSGQAMEMMEALMKKLPEGFGYSWSGMSYQERLSGAQAPILYSISLLVVFLCLAALYESWSIPFSVLLVVPLGVFGALAGTMLRGMNNDVYFQVGLLTVVGLSAKNSILIVEFARELVNEGRSVLDATLHAVRLRLRPIVMTSMAFILGVMPLAISSGAGSGAQNAIGTAVVAGTISATVLGLFATPLFFTAILHFFSRSQITQQTQTTGESHEK